MTNPASSGGTPAPGADAPARFRVRGIFVLGIRSLFIVRGDVVSGSVRAKQRVAGIPGMDAAIESVQHNLLDIEGGAPQSALTFRYDNQSQLARWKSLVTTGMLLTLEPA